MAAVMTSASSTKNIASRDLPRRAPFPASPASLAMATCRFFPFPAMNLALAMVHRTERIAQPIRHLPGQRHADGTEG